MSYPFSPITPAGLTTSSKCHSLRCGTAARWWAAGAALPGRATAAGGAGWTWSRTSRFG